MQNRIVLLLIASIFILSCKSTIKVSDEYKKEILSYRLSQHKALTEGDDSPLTVEESDAIDHFLPDPAYRVMADLVMTKDAKPFTISTYSGTQKSYLEYAKANFKIKGKSKSLLIYRDLKMIKIPGFNQKLFVMYKDLTNGDSTYGGGRYLYLDMKDVIDGRVVIDFNKSFNPYCAYSDGYNCPIPPIENHLDIMIRAGEMDFNLKQ